VIHPFQKYFPYQKYLFNSTYLNVLLGILKVVEQSVFSPCNTRLLVRSGVRVSIGLSRLAAEETVEVGSLLVRSSLLNSVALRALCLEDLGSLLCVWSLAHLDLTFFVYNFQPNLCVKCGNANALLVVGEGLLCRWRAVLVRVCTLDFCGRNFDGARRVSPMLQDSLLCSVT
jgi:hypothetical protein